MTIYSFSKFANYTQIHMYVFFGIFTNELKKKKLEDLNYKLDVSIDGNVTKWILDTPERKISNIFKKIIQDTVIDKKIIDTAISEIEQKNEFTSKMKDLDLLDREITNVCFTKKKPEISNDSMSSPAIDFYK